MRPRRLTAIAYMWTVAAVLIASTVSPMPQLEDLAHIGEPFTYAAAVLLGAMPFIRSAYYRAATIAIVAFDLIAQFLAIGLANHRRPWLTMGFIAAILLGLINTVITDHDIERPWERTDDVA